LPFATSPSFNYKTTSSPITTFTKRRSIALFRQPPWVKYWYIFSMDNSEILCCTGKLIEFLPDTEADFALWIFWPCQSRQV